MKQNFKLLHFTLILLFLSITNVLLAQKSNTSCSLHNSYSAKADEDKNSMYIINAGDNNTNGSVSLIDKDNNITNWLYKKNNNNAMLGKNTQFATIYGYNFYFVSQKENVLVIADATTLATKKVITSADINNAEGRTFVGVTPKKGYLSTTEGIFIVDIETLSLGEKISGINTEIGDMLCYNNYVFALAEKSVFILDKITNEIVKTISGHTYGGITSTIDETVWIGADTILMQVNTNNMRVTNISLTEEQRITQSWGSKWHSGRLCAGVIENYVYWANDIDGKNNIFQYNGNMLKLQTIEGYRMLGAGMRVNLGTNKLNAILSKTFSMGVSPIRIYKQNNDGKFDLTEVKPDNKNAIMPVFFDQAPVVEKTVEDMETCIGADTIVMFITDIVSDEDNFVNYVADIADKDIADVQVQKVRKYYCSCNQPTIYQYLRIFVKKEGATTITLTAEDNGKTVSTNFDLTVKSHSQLGIATFEKFKLKENSVFGRENAGIYSFADNGFIFRYTVAPLNGAIISNNTNNTEYGDYNHTSTAITGKGVNNSKNYLVMSKMENIYTDSKSAAKPTAKPKKTNPRIRIYSPNNQGQQINGVYVTNTTYAMSAMEKGMGLDAKFGGEQGTNKDWFKLTAVGYNNKTLTDSVGFYLADFRFDNSAEDYIVKDWQYVDLSKLGKITEVEFRLSSNKKNINGETSLDYFCLDNLNEQCATGLTEKKAKININIYPNPVVSDLFIDSPFKIKYIVITDVNGKIVKTVNKPNSKKLTVDNLKKGMYIVRVVGNNATSITKFIKE